MDNNCNDEEGETKRRRSSRLSGNYGKRKRITTEEEEEARTKMPKTGETSEPATVNFTMDKLKVYMNGEFRASINQDMDKKFDNISKRVDQNQMEIRTHKEKMDRELKKMREELESSKNAPPITYAVAAKSDVVKSNRASRRSEEEANQYWRSRRSSRFFPILGDTEEELRESLGDFLDNKLCMPTNDVLPSKIEHIRRVRLRRRKQNIGEVIVLFKDIEVRDRVSSFARNLAEFADPKGKPTAGIRFDIPDHLSGVHNMVMQCGPNMTRILDLNATFASMMPRCPFASTLNSRRRKTGSPSTTPEHLKTDEQTP